MKIDPQILRQLREERSWTQEHLAEAAGVSLRTVQRIEREGNASADSRLAIASAFGVDVSVLVGRTEEPTVPAPEIAVSNTPVDPPGKWARESFLRHLVVYLVVCSFLVYLDFSSGGQVHWSKWPLMGWGFGLMMHGISAWSRSSRPRDEESSDRKRRRSFPDRVRIYAVMSVAFLVIDFMANSRITWAFYPIAGWGLGLLLGWNRAKAA